ncbi:hypothetical protein SAMN05428953_12633 [Mesorhizobium muleiense]|uniref:Uncharacterized protein n=1 Tax=Mesorhizobium muleiense TaxID=1004279 RepID=A0A1G9H0V0_9HYPH|nr:hypothetical protein [Mesorhizobium muleiense]SDL06568.1 hypothetical protein SAMN05428953_12633 [Mesorhizobium muleiense]
MRYTRLFYSGYLFFAATISAVLSLPWLDARSALDFNAMRSEAHDNPAPLSRFRAFVARALKHDCFTAGYFDPGRSFA